MPEAAPDFVIYFVGTQGEPDTAWRFDTDGALVPAIDEVDDVSASMSANTFP